MRRAFGLAGIFAALVLSGGCPDPPNRAFTPSAGERWDFDMGRQGSGSVRFSAIGLENGAQTGECATPVCHTRIENRASLRLTATASPGFRFLFWVDDPAQHLPCDGTDRLSDTLQLVVVRNGACFAVFEPIGGSAPTTPGAR